MLKYSFLALFFLLPQLCLFGHAAENPLQASPPAPEVYPPTDQMLAAMLMFGFRGERVNAQDGIGAFISKGRPCNVILFDKDVTENSSRNISSPEQVKALTTALRQLAKEPVFIAVDQEGGQVRRLKPQKGFMDLPSAQKLGQGNTHETLETASALGKELAGLGINVDLAPVADVDVNPFNPAIGKLGRAFNTDPALVSAHALAFGQGLAKNGVIPVLKHFPGQGCAEKDTHLAPADVSQCWNANTDLLPYAEIFQAGWPGMVMIGHIHLREMDPVLPATLSPNIVIGLLREGMNWHGVVISDDLQMKAVTDGHTLKETLALALKADIDILLYGNNLEWDEELPEKVWQALHELISEGELSEERIRQSWKRIDNLKKAYNFVSHKD